MPIADVLAEFPEELRLPLLRLTEVLRDAVRAELAVRREDFELLVEAQRRSEERMDRVEVALEKLAEAQRRTEERVEELAEAQRRTEERVEELAEAQRRTEERVEELAEAQRRTEKRVEELAEAQRRSEERLDRVEAVLEKLAEAQRRTEERMEELAEAQRRTEEQIATLVGAVAELERGQRELRRQYGGLSATIGYTLENEAYKALPRLLAHDYGLEVEGRLRRGYVQLPDGSHLEVNILGTAHRNGTTLTIVGEAKSQLSKQDVDRFLKRRVKPLQTVYPEIFPVLVTHMIGQPDVEDYARERGVALYYSYDF